MLSPGLPLSLPLTVPLADLGSGGWPCVSAQHNARGKRHANAASMPPSNSYRLSRPTEILLAWAPSFPVLQWPPPVWCLMPVLLLPTLRVVAAGDPGQVCPTCISLVFAFWCHYLVPFARIYLLPSPSASACPLLPHRYSTEPSTHGECYHFYHRCKGLSCPLCLLLHLTQAPFANPPSAASDVSQLPTV